MSRLKADDDKLAPEGIRARASDEPKQDEDTEGHMFVNMDPGTSRGIAKGRSAEIERELRDRQRAKEARPNKR